MKKLVEINTHSVISKQLESNAKPFLRWAGGKRWLLKYLESINSLKINNYHEPFLGGASVFFNIKNYHTAYLSDLNSELIETYVCLRDNLNNVIKVLSDFKNTEDEYYKIRGRAFEKKHERAAKFIFLNKTSYNGIYRVNSKGDFNVPYGFRAISDLVDKKNLELVSKKLQGVNLEHKDFEQSIEDIKRDDLVFLDPPYTVAHENNGFIAYNQKIFSIEDQKKLALFIERIREIGAFYILTNAKHDAIEEIYNKIDPPIILSRASNIGGLGARREQFKEYIFSNFLVNN